MPKEMINLNQYPNISLMEIKIYLFGLFYFYALTYLIIFTNSIILSNRKMQNAAQMRKNRMATIRASMQEISTIRKNTISIENKLAKKSLSLKVEGDPDNDQKEKELVAKIQQLPSLGKFQQKYELGDKIGQGSNGFVKKCYCRSTKQLFAVKSISMDQQHIMFLKANFKYIKELNHQNIIKYHVMYLDNKKKTCYLVMDYDSNPSLLHFNDLSEDEVREIVFQLLSTLAYIHSKKICHRDIKPENILYDRAGKKIKLIDFGISKKLQNRGYKKQMLTITGTLNYRAPEMFLGGGYDQKVDIWAAGVTMYQLLSKGKTPFQSDFLSNTIENITKGQVQYPDQIWNHYNKFAKDLVSRLLRKRQDRLTAAEAKKHFWFQQDNDQVIDLTKSDNIKLAFGLKKKRTAENAQQNFIFQRSLTNNLNNIQSAIEACNSTDANEKGKNILKKWLAEGGSDDDLIDIESEEEDVEDKTPVIVKD